MAESFVIGSSLAAFKFAIKRDLKLISFFQETPFRYDKELYHKWAIISMLLSLNGQWLFKDMAVQGIIENDTLTAIGQIDKLADLKFDKLYIFDEANLVGLPQPKKEAERNLKVADYLRANPGVRLNFTILEDKTCDLANWIDIGYSECFFHKNRIDEKKVAVAFSYCTEQQLSEQEWSEAMVRIKFRKMLTKRILDEGIFKTSREATNGMSMFNLRREVVRLWRDTYKDTKNLKFIRNYNEDTTDIFYKIKNVKLQRLVNCLLQKKAL